MEDKDISEIVFQIYSAVHAPQTWPTVLDRLADQFNANGVIIWEWSGPHDNRKLKSPFFSSYYQRDVLEGYLNRHQDSEFADQERFEQKSLAFGRAAPDQIDLVSELDLYPDEAAYLAKPHAQELLSYGIRHRYGALLDRDNPFHARFSLQTSKKRGQLAPEEQSVLAHLLPHFAKALELAEALHVRLAEREAFLDALNSFDVGICILDKKSRVIEKNAEFERQIEEFGAFWIGRDAQLSLHDRANRKLFDHLLEDFRNHGAYGARPRKEAVLVRSDDKAGAICIEILPPTRLSDAGYGEDHFAVLLSRDTTREIQIDLTSVKCVFQLTDAEAIVMDLLCGGRTNAEIAARRGRSVETVNAQVKSVLSKTGTANRTQLVRLMCNFPQVA